MREIKFRAWDYQYNRWATNNVVSGSVGLVFGIKDYFINIAGEKAVRFAFMQFTGLHDKNNHPIYEGDKWIPDDASGDIFEVYFRDGKFQTNSPYKLTFGIVVGNIYENPDLLK